MKLKGIELKGTYKVEFNDMWFAVYDTKSNVVYYEDNYGYWFKKKYDEKDNRIYYKNSEGYWFKSEYDDKRNMIYFESSKGIRFKKKYDEKGNEIYYEDSDGNIIDNEVQELTVEEIEKILGYKIKIKEIENDK